MSPSQPKGPRGRLRRPLSLAQALEGCIAPALRRQGFGELEIVPDTAGIPRVVYGTLYNEI